MTSGPTWMLNLRSMSSQTESSVAWGRLAERGDRSFKQTLAMATVRSRRDDRSSCEALELISLWGPPICSEGIDGGWATGGSGVTVALPARTYELVVEDVGGPTVSPAASKVIGMALVWRGGDLCRGEFCIVGKGEARGGLRRRFLLREAGLRGRRPWEVVWL